VAEDTNVNLDAETAALVAMIIALKDIDDNLKKAYEEYMKPTRNMAVIIGLVKNSKFYQDFNALARTRRITQAEQPGVYAQDKEKYKTEQKKRLAAAGIAWNTDVEKQVESAYDLALDDDVLDKLIVATGKFGKITGAAGATIEDLQDFANSYGVGSLYDQKYWYEQRQDMFLGVTNAQKIQEDIKQRAIDAYPAWAKGFNENKSLNTQAGWIKSLVAQQLGIDPNSLTFDDPTVAPFLNYKDPKSGQQVIPSLLDVRTQTRTKYFDQFAQTPEGRSYMDGLTVKVLQDMGLI
jgi:hypothetical protein